MPSDTAIVIIISIVALHFLIGIGYVFYKIFGKKDPN